MKKLFLFGLLVSFLFGQNSMYIWSKTFNKLSNSKIIKVLKKDKIGIAIVSASANPLKLKYFLRLAKKNHIKVEFLLGYNKWIFENNRYLIDKKLNYLKQFKNPYIHLDVEPHAIKSLKKDRIKYWTMYVEMLKYIKSKYPNYTIDISIPTFYRIDYVTQMSKYVDKIYLMAYQYKNMAQLIRRVNRYKKFKDRLFVAFNCKEFKSKKHLKNDVKTFISKTGYKNIAYHSLKSCMKLR